MTAYEDYVLKILAVECGIPKSAVVRVALLKLLSNLMKNTGVVEKLPPGYDNMLRQLGSEAEEVLDRCINRLSQI